MPLNGGCLPKGDQLMPNAPRVYRNGTHEGIDFYESDNCTRIARGTEVLAAKGGRVVRADLAYIDITAEEVARYSQNPNTDEALDKYRGRQVWIEHGNDATGNKIVTRYAHLSGIASGIAVGTAVVQGQLVAYVGESGTPESVSSPGRENHLHFEVRIGDSYLGKALPAAQVRTLYMTLFGP
jgi:murein DD-endopeptidase MepM/ murein hydrolase activator NlpD